MEEISTALEPRRRQDTLNLCEQIHQDGHTYPDAATPTYTDEERPVLGDDLRGLKTRRVHGRRRRWVSLPLHTQESIDFALQFRRNRSKGTDERRPW